MKTNTNEPHGFTLIELLVVISIIALLVSIMLPALNRARYTARRMVCLTNVRAQFQVQNLYAIDNDGRFPTHWDYSPAYVRSIAGNQGHSLVREQLDSYVEDSSMLLCPVFSSWGPNYQRTDSISTNGEYGGWDARNPSTGQIPTNVNGVYFWYANYRAVDGSLPQFKFISRDNLEVHTPPWPDRLSDCHQDRAFISHIVYYHWNFDLTWDLSHGGQPSPVMGSALFAEASNALDSPVGYADGHVEFHSRDNMWPRAKIVSSWYAPLEVYY